MSGFDTTYRIRLGNYRVVYIVDDAARVITVTASDTEGGSTDDQQSSAY